MPRGYKILLEVLGRGVYRGVQEVPYTFLERARGGSKMGPTQLWLYLLHLLRLSYETGEGRQIIKCLVIGLAVIILNATAILCFQTHSLTYLAMIAFLGAQLGWMTYFALKELVSWRESRELRSSLRRRFVRFQRLSITATFGNVSVVYLFTGILGQSILLAGLSGAVLGLFLNAWLKADALWISEPVHSTSSISGN